MTAHDRYPGPHDGWTASICALSARTSTTLIQGLELEGKSFFGMSYAQHTLLRSISLKTSKGGMYGNDGVRP